MIDARTCTSERLERLVRVRVIFSAEDGLYRLCHHCPVSLQVSSERVLVEDELAQALLE